MQNLRGPGIEPGSTAWKAAMLTTSHAFCFSPQNPGPAAVCLRLLLQQQRRTKRYLFFYLGFVFAFGFVLVNDYQLSCHTAGFFFIDRLNAVAMLELDVN